MYWMRPSGSLISDFGLFWVKCPCACQCFSKSWISKREKVYSSTKYHLFEKRKRNILQNQINEDFFIILKSSTDREMKIKFSDSREKTWIISSQDILDLETFVNAWNPRLLGSLRHHPSPLTYSGQLLAMCKWRLPKKCSKVCSFTKPGGSPRTKL